MANYDATCKQIIENRTKLLISIDFYLIFTSLHSWSQNASHGEWGQENFIKFQNKSLEKSTMETKWKLNRIQFERYFSLFWLRHWNVKIETSRLENEKLIQPREKNICNKRQISMYSLHVRVNSMENDLSSFSIFWIRIWNVMRTTFPLV